MTMLPPYPRTGLVFKLIECLLAAIGLLSTFLAVIEIVVFPLLGDDLQAINRYEEYGLLGIIALSVLGTFVYAVVWHRREQLGLVQGGERHAWLQAIVRYWLAFSISTYGFAKVLETQFETPTYRLDMPLGSVSDMALTWYYYGHSYTLAVIIALFQIGGSILLLYRQTTLLGVMILLPVMVNIVLINVIFGITSGALFNSVIFTLALVFLLLLDMDKLKAAFWDLVERLPALSLGRSGPWAKQGLRLLVIVGAFSMVYRATGFDKSDKVLRGTWKVEQFSRNGQVLPANAWQTDTAAWQRVYFSGWMGCVFSPNPYRYKPAESWRGNYEFDSTKNKLRLLMYRSDAAKVPDTIQATLTGRTDKAMRLRGTWQGDTLDMQLARLR